MRRHCVIGLASLAIAALCCLVLGMFSREPVYAGKRWGGWLRDLRHPSPRVRHAAQVAFRAMGTNSVPLLREMLHATDSPARTNLYLLLARQRIIRLDLAPARERRIRAALACVVIGPDAAELAPDLLAFSKEDSFCFNLAESALGHLGQAAVAPLSVALTNETYDARRLAAGALLEIGPPAGGAVPVLLKRLDDDYIGIRATAARALGRIGVVTPEVVRALVIKTGDPATEVRWPALMTLEDFGARALPALERLLDDPEADLRSGAARALEASPAIPALRQAANDPDGKVQRAAERALQTIQERATKHR